MLGPAAGPTSGVEGSGDGPPRRLLAFGESTSAGHGVAMQREAIPCKVAQLVAERDGVAVAWETIGFGGATAAAVVEHTLPRVHGTHNDVALLLLGLNDVFALTDAALWRRQVDVILDAAEATLRPGGRVIFSGLPAADALPAVPEDAWDVIGGHGRLLDDVIADLAAARPAVVHVPAPVFGPDAFSSDGVHPGAAAYRVWAERLAAAWSPAG